MCTFQRETDREDPAPACFLELTTATVDCFLEKHPITPAVTKVCDFHISMIVSFYLPIGLPSLSQLMLGTGTPVASHSRATREPRVEFKDSLRGPSSTGGTVETFL